MKQLRVGLVGLGFGLRYMRDVMQTACARALLDIRAVCDVRPQRLQEAARAFEAGACADVEELLSIPEIEAVVLFTGPAGRAELIGRIIRAGKHVMTTKPFELDASQALCVLREAEQLGRIVHMNSPSPHLRDDLRQITDWQRSYDLGRPVAAHFQTWCAYRESADGTWYDDADLCPVAPIFRLGIYAINDVLHFLPEPEEVQVMHSRICTGRPTPDHAQLGIRFRGGELATIFASFCIDTGLPYPDRLTLNFERGCVYRNAPPAAAATTAELQLVARGRDGRPVFDARTFEGPQCSGHTSYQWETFCRAARGEVIEPTVSPEQVVAGIRVIEAMARSERSGRAERIRDEASTTATTTTTPCVSVRMSVDTTTAAAPAAEARS